MQKFKKEILPAVQSNVLTVEVNNLPRLEARFGWLVVLGLNGPVRQYFSLYQAVSQREGERKEK